MNKHQMHLIISKKEKQRKWEENKVPKQTEDI